jgi:hypothetical protein
LRSTLARHLSTSGSELLRKHMKPMLYAELAATRRSSASPSLVLLRWSVVVRNDASG